GPAEDLYAAVGGRHRAEDRERSSEPVRRFLNYGGNGGDADYGSRHRRGGDGAFSAEGSAARAEGHCGGRGDVFDLAADSALQRVPELGRSGPARADRRHRREDQRLLRLPLAVRTEDGYHH